MTGPQIADLQKSLSQQQVQAVMALLSPDQVKALQAKVASGKLMNLWSGPDRRYAHTGINSGSAPGGSPNAPGGAYMTSAQFANLKNLSPPQIAASLQIATPAQLADLSTSLPGNKIDAVMALLTPAEVQQVMSKMPAQMILLI